MPFCVIKSRTIKIVFAMAVVVCLLSISFYGGSAAQVFFGYSTRLVPIYCVDTKEKQVALSYDAAWGADKTDEIISVLKEFDVKATFFLVGFWVDKYPDKVNAIKDAGMEIGTHTNTHPDLAKAGMDTIKTELQLSIDKIEAITGQKPELFRAPFGSYNNNVINVASSLGLKTIQWNIDSLDWKGLSASDINARVIKNLVPGSIILMHNNADNVVAATRLVLQGLKEQGYKVSSVGELIYKDGYTIDNTGKQIKK